MITFNEKNADLTVIQIFRLCFVMSPYDSQSL